MKKKPPRRTRSSRASDPERVGARLDPELRAFLADAFAASGASEGTLWIRNAAGTHLVPVHNSGPDAARFVGRFRQPAGSGLIGLVMASEQPFLENDVAGAAGHSKSLDRRLKLRTLGMIAVPFALDGACAGVLSCVRLQGRGGREFGPEDLDRMQRTASLLGRLLEARG